MPKNECQVHNYTNIYKLCVNCYNCKMRVDGKIKCSEGFFDEVEYKDCILSPLDFDCFYYEG